MRSNPLSVRQLAPQLAARDGGWVCHYCGEPLRNQGTPNVQVEAHRNHYGRWQTCIDEATIDHVIPTSKGGTHDIDNLVLACNTCNARKGNRDYHDFRNQYSVEP